MVCYKTRSKISRILSLKIFRIANPWDAKLIKCALSVLIHKRTPVHVGVLLLLGSRRLEALLRRWTQDVRRRYQRCIWIQFKPKARLIEFGNVKVSSGWDRFVDEHIAEYRKNTFSVGAILKVLLKWTVALRHDEVIAIGSTGVRYDWYVIC